MSSFGYFILLWDNKLLIVYYAKPSAVLIYQSKPSMGAMKSIQKFHSNRSNRLGGVHACCYTLVARLLTSIVQSRPTLLLKFAFMYKNYTAIKFSFSILLVVTLKNTLINNFIKQLLLIIYNFIAFRSD